jgi:hypothetical protein
MRWVQALPVFVTWGALVGLVVGLGQSCDKLASSTSSTTESETSTSTGTGKDTTPGKPGQMTTATATDAAASGPSCTDQGRIFESGKVPSLDGCNSCRCTCDALEGAEVECAVACTERACDPQPKLPVVGQDKVFDPAGHELTYQGIACPAPKACAVDWDYVEACERHGGIAVDNGCCDYTCSVKLVREEPLVPNEAETCKDAAAGLAALMAELTTVSEGDSASSRRHPCQDDTDCKLVPASPPKACSGELAVGVQAYKEVAAAIAAQTAEVERTCPRFVGECAPSPKTARAACVSAYCGTEVSSAPAEGPDDEDEDEQ